MTPDPARNMPGRHHAHGPDTEREAAERVAPRTGTQRARVLDALQRAGEGGCTDYELWYLMRIGARPHVPGTRREELIADGWPIVDSGERRRTDTGAQAIVWTLREPAEREAAPGPAGSRSAHAVTDGDRAVPLQLSLGDAA